ncbi:hypothetical protein BDV23DRAFT_152282 [Aspergillus alliaceus]|uniref:Uncharacterized protein n=1 Tax=Petromyces alliaceus TaxID=209559 RepID=A0A5N7CCM8_PETAA|nr:hypothetical protein BDV23DRAFT_152282 [Aspergillus alliaceus]
MQSLWSRAASARSTCHCVSCLSTATPGIASRAASAASKKRLRIGNSVTALYTSIFAAAALADAQAKNQRRHEWQEKIAAVKEEVNALVDEEQRLLANILSRRKRRTLFNGIPLNRQYSTLARSLPQTLQGVSWNIPTRSVHSNASLREFPDRPDSRVLDGLETHLDIVDDYGNEILEELVDEHATWADDNQDEYDFGVTADDTFPEWLSYDLLRQKAVRKLALKQLAIRLLLRPAIAHPYSGLRQHYASSAGVPKLNVAELLRELNSIRYRIRDLKSMKDANIDDLVKDLRVRDFKTMASENEKLDKEISQLTKQYLEDRIPLQEFLLRLASNLLQSTDPDRPFALKHLLIAFSKTRQNDLGDLVLKTLLPNKFTLDAPLILSILNFYRRSKNLKGFDLFLELLRGDSFPVDLGNLSYYERVVINGVELSVPPVASANPVVYTILITTCLRFNQPDRADAYAEAAKAAGCSDNFIILNAYLKFYAIRSDWEKGTQTIKRALAYMISSSQLPLYEVERLIVLLVHLCDSCKRYDVSRAIIKAAVENKFNWRSAQMQTDIFFPTDPELRRWHAAENRLTTTNEEKSQWERYLNFVTAIQEQLDELTLPQEGSYARRWHKLVGTYSQQVLSAALEGCPTPNKKPKDNAQQFFKLFDVEDDKFYQAEATAKAHQKEIMALKDQVAQLKRMVFDLAKQAPANGNANSNPNDLGQLKEKLKPANSHVVEPQSINIRYVES